MNTLQDTLSYQVPPKIIADLIDADSAPIVSLSPNEKWLLLLPSPSLLGIEELASEELRLAGVRFKPDTNGPSRAVYSYALTFKNIATKEEISVDGLPKSAKINNLGWSPDGMKFAFTITQADGISLWLTAINQPTAHKLTGNIINNVMPGRPFLWLPDNKTILYYSIVPMRGNPPHSNLVPKGPIVQVNDGKTAPVRTYQDLLKNPNDEAIFEYYATAQLMRLDIETGETKPFLEPAIFKGILVSPDGKYILVLRVQKPFSYIVPLDRFPFTVDIFDIEGNFIKKIAQIPLSDNIPTLFDAVRVGKRNFEWRADMPATLVWVEAQDGGDPRNMVDVRDILYMLPAPFTSEPQVAFSFKWRYAGMNWGTGDLAIAHEYWWQTRKTIATRWQPNDPNAPKDVIFDRSSEDHYNNPGDFETKVNEFGRYVLRTADNEKSLFLMGMGASSEGNRPFIDKFDLSTKATTRLWRAAPPFHEVPIGILDEEKLTVLTRRESKNEPPNYVVRNLQKGNFEYITHFENPYQALKDVKKELITYKRSDGLDLTGTLYLPKNYDKDRDGRLPVLMWAYPKEYKSMHAAGQVTDSPNEFMRPHYSLPIFWALRGYAVFDDFATPIIGEGSEEPNETFIEQLRMDAEAAVNYLVDTLGITDRNRIAVGGHSYGAFMTANLLAHTDLFAAGIARSGAYNRTLTPFGFQAEERTLWEAPETYMKMSPFVYADKIKSPLLLIHGEADNNAGTFPMQSERFYQALKGLGATVRYVALPYESHGYQARESIMHMLWEMDSWLEKYCKKEKSVLPS